jgi:phosphatidylserine/phosphatidylglycerophosphate/cardiolipin synthase-like enzyme
MLKHAVKHKHTLVRFMTQQLVLLAIQIGLVGRDNRSDRYNEDQRVSLRIKITIMLSW